MPSAKFFACYEMFQVGKGEVKVAVEGILHFLVRSKGITETTDQTEGLDDSRSYLSLEFVLLKLRITASEGQVNGSSVHCHSLWGDFYILPVHASTSTNIETPMYDFVVSDNERF